MELCDEFEGEMKVKIEDGPARIIRVYSLVVQPGDIHIDEGKVDVPDLKEGIYTDFLSTHTHTYRLNYTQQCAFWMLYASDLQYVVWDVDLLCNLEQS